MHTIVAVPAVGIIGGGCGRRGGDPLSGRAWGKPQCPPDTNGTTLCPLGPLRHKDASIKAPLVQYFASPHNAFLIPPRGWPELSLHRGWGSNGANHLDGNVGQPRARNETPRREVTGRRGIESAI